MNYHPSWVPFFASHPLPQIPESEEIYPPPALRFRVFEMDVAEIRIVLLGQDPYHQPGQAMGLSFSVPPAIKVPPSLKNIQKEIRSNFPDRHYTFSGGGDLSRWHSEEKIFLLNASLTVERGKPGSHLKFWEPLTDAVIQYIAEQNSRAIFLLLGNYAIQKARWIEDQSRVLTTSHPSPLGAYKGFLGSGIFRRCEEILREPVCWDY